MDSGLLKASGMGSGNMESGKEKLRADLDGVVSDAGDMLKDAANSSVEKLSVAREQAKEKLNEAKAQLAQAGTAVKGGAKHAADATSEYVKGHPWQSIGVAAIAALLVGFLFSRR